MMSRALHAHQAMRRDPPDDAASAVSGANDSATASAAQQQIRAALPIVGVRADGPVLQVDLAETVTT